MPIATIKMARDNQGPRRTQFSSCDACRNSRVACDAARVGHEPGKTNWAGSCSRCTRRKRRCTFEWISNVKKAATEKTEPRRETRSLSTTTSESILSSESPEQHHAITGVGLQSGIPHLDDYTTQKFQDYPRLPSCDSFFFVPHSKSDITSSGLTSPLDTANALWGRWLDLIFQNPFESIFGWWSGRHCCPLVDDPTGDIIISPTRLFSDLDASMGDDWEIGNQTSPRALSAQRQEREYEIDQALRRAIRAFSSRWLPLVVRDETPRDNFDDIIRQFWRVSRNDMLKVINRVSYRSVLTLFLFGLTPIPIGITEEEESEGLTGQICVQAALQQVQRLRERQRNCQFNGAKVSPGTDTFASPTPSTNLTIEYINFESRAYWTALVFDTSASLSLNFRSSLTSGLHGFSSEPAWNVIKMWLAGSFHTRTEDWRENGFEVTDEKASQVFASAATCKLYVWKMIAVLKEALREGATEAKVVESWTALIEGLEIFKVTIRPLLKACERRLPFLGQVERMNWYETALHYYLGILILVDAIEAAQRPDLLSQLADVRADAEHEAFNAIKFGLESEYTILEPRSSSFDSFTGPPRRSISKSFLAIDPYPHHVVASVRLVNKVVSREYHQGKIKQDAYTYLSSTLVKALEQLPQSSKSVQAALQYLQSSLKELNTPLTPEMKMRS